MKALKSYVRFCLNRYTKNNGLDFKPKYKAPRSNIKTTTEKGPRDGLNKEEIEAVVEGITQIIALSRDIVNISELIEEIVNIEITPREALDESIVQVRTPEGGMSSERGTAHVREEGIVITCDPELLASDSRNLLQKFRGTLLFVIQGTGPCRIIVRRDTDDSPFCVL